MSSSSSIPVYRNGRKFYVSPDEYERLRSEERRHRRRASQKSQHMPARFLSPSGSFRYPSAASYNPVHRSQSNPYDYKYGLIHTPQTPINSLTNTGTRRAINRPSRLSTKTSNDQDDLSSNTSAGSKKPTIITPEKPIEKSIETTRRNSSSSETESDIKRSFSAEISRLSLNPPQRKQTSARRPIPMTISDYGMAPITSYSMTPNDQSYTQTIPSKLTNYFARIKQSSLNPPSAQLTNDSFYESGIQGTDHLFSVLGTSNRRTNRISSSILTRSKSDTNKNPFTYSDTASGTSFSDENSSSLFSLMQQRTNELIRPQNSNYTKSDIEDEFNQSRNLWTRSTDRSLTNDTSFEKKRVRFADTEGFTLETVPIRDQLISSQKNRLLQRRTHTKPSNESRRQSRPFYNTFYQPTTKISETRLVTDV